MKNMGRKEKEGVEEGERGRIHTKQLMAHRSEETDTDNLLKILYEYSKRMGYNI